MPDIPKLPAFDEIQRRLDQVSQKTRTTLLSDYFIRLFVQDGGTLEDAITSYGYYIRGVAMTLEHHVEQLRQQATILIGTGYTDEATTPDGVVEESHD